MLFVFITALFTTTKLQTQPRCQRQGPGMKETGFVDTMNCFQPRSYIICRNIYAMKIITFVKTASERKLRFLFFVTS